MRNLPLVFLCIRCTLAFHGITGTRNQFSPTKFGCPQTDFSNGKILFWQTSPSRSSVRLRRQNFASSLRLAIVPSWLRNTFSRLRNIFSEKSLQPPENDSRMFFNREMEIAELKQKFYGPPRFTVMLGPPSTGKSRLINQVLSSLRADGTREFHALKINLRGLESNTRNASAVDDAWRSFVEMSSRIDSIEMSSLKFGVLQGSNQNKYQELVDSLVQAVPVWTKGSDRPYILVVDEVNSLKTLANNDDSVSYCGSCICLSFFHAFVFKKSFRDFMEFAIKASKEQGRLHVVFACSDSLFQKWIENRGNFKILLVDSWMLT